MKLKNKFDIKIFDNIKRVDEYLIELFLTKIKNESQIIISSGNSLKKFFIKLNKIYKKWNNIKLYLADERIVPESSKYSNKSCLIELLNNNNNNINNLVSEFKNYSAQESKILLKKIEKKTNNIKNINTAILSVASDGHIASLFFKKDEEIFFSKNFLICKNKKDSFRRISFNNNFFSKLNLIVLVIVGKKKSHLITMLNKNDKLDSNIPFIKLIKDSNKKVLILTHRQCYNMS